MSEIVYCTLFYRVLFFFFSVAVVTRRAVATGTRLRQTLSSSTGNTPNSIILRLGAQRMLGVSLPHNREEIKSQQLSPTVKSSKVGIHCNYDYDNLNCP